MKNNCDIKVYINDMDYTSLSDIYSVKASPATPVDVRIDLTSTVVSDYLNLASEPVIATFSSYSRGKSLITGSEHRSIGTNYPDYTTRIIYVKPGDTDVINVSVTWFSNVYTDLEPDLYISCTHGGKLIADWHFDIQLTEGQ